MQEIVHDANNPTKHPMRVTWDKDQVVQTTNPTQRMHRDRILLAKAYSYEEYLKHIAKIYPAKLKTPKKSVKKNKSSLEMLYGSPGGGSPETPVTPNADP